MNVLFFMGMIWWGGVIVALSMETFNDGTKFRQNLMSLVSYLIFLGICFGGFTYFNNVDYDINVDIRSVSNVERISDTIENDIRTITEVTTKTCVVYYSFNRPFIWADHDDERHEYDTPCSEVDRDKIEQTRLRYMRELNDH